MDFAMTSVPIRKDWAGRVVDGRLPLLQWLGGTEGCGVFLTERPGKAGERSVIKLLPAAAADAEHRAAGWDAARELEHLHLLRLYEWGRWQIDGAELAYVVTEYAPEVLGEILPGRVLAAEEARALLEPLVEALDYLHGQGLVHGHVKPANIMAQGEELKLTADHLLRAGAGSGVLPAGEYDAPELAQGVVTPAADVWSLGVTLVEVLTQRRPALGANGEPVVPAEVPEPFGEIARACLQVDAAKRCVLGEIRTWLRPAEPVVRQRVEPAVAGGRDSLQGTRTWIRVVGVLALVTVMAMVWFLRSHANGNRGARENPVLAAPVESSSAPASGTPVRVRSVVARRVPPEVLRSALETIHGTVRVEVRVTAGTGGKVVQAVFTEHGPSGYFADAAMKAARQWVFRPAEVNGRAVQSVWLLQFGFTRDGSEVTATEVLP
jgi:hypothetical protein